MAFLRSVDVFPPTGFVDQPWRDDPDEDAFVRSSRRVCERYSEALREVVPRMANRVSRLTILTATHEGADAELEVDLDGPRVVAEWSTVSLPAGVSSLTPSDRALLVLEVVDLSMRTLAAARGWDPEAIDDARRHVEEHGLSYTRVGSWKADPSRSLKARLRSELADDGFGRTWVEVAGRRDGHLVRSVGPYLGYCTREGLRRAERTVRWSGSGVIQVAPFVDLLGETNGVVTIDLGRDVVTTDLVPTATPRGVGDRSARPAVRLRTPTPRGETHEIFVGGGGLYDARCADYLDAVYRYLGQLNDETWLRWWSTSPVPRLEIGVWTWDKAPAVSARRRGGEVRAAIKRRAAEMGVGATAAAAAKADVDALIGLIGRRFDLGPPPTLREGASLGPYEFIVSGARDAYAGPFPEDLVDNEG